MKVIFLDIDGVLNSMSCKVKIEGFDFVEDEKVALLKEIIDLTDAKVVLSSTWRYGRYEYYDSNGNYLLYDGSYCALCGESAAAMSTYYCEICKEDIPALTCHPQSHYDASH